MNIKLVRLTVLLATLLVVGVGSVHAADTSKERTAMAGKIFTSLEKGDYDLFVSDADAGWKQRAPKGSFGGIAGMMVPKMKGGYDYVFLGELKGPGGAQRTLWKLTLKGTNEEMLVAIDFKEGKVTFFGFPK